MPRVIEKQLEKYKGGIEGKMQFDLYLYRDAKVFHVAIHMHYTRYLFLYNHSNRYHKEYMYCSCTSAKYVHTDILKRAYMGFV